jgi:hypothetical protein
MIDKKYDIQELYDIRDNFWDCEVEKTTLTIIKHLIAIEETLNEIVEHCSKATFTMPDEGYARVSLYKPTPADQNKNIKEK